LCDLGKGNGEDLLLVLLERKWRSVSCIVSGYITWLIVRDGNVSVFLWFKGVEEMVVDKAQEILIK